MLAVKFVTAHSREVFKFLSVRRHLGLFSVNFMDENACSYVWATAFESYIYNSEHIF